MKVDGLDYSTRQQPGKGKGVLRNGSDKGFFCPVFNLKCSVRSWMSHRELWKVCNGFYLEEEYVLGDDPHNHSSSQEMSLSYSMNFSELEDSLLRVAVLL